MKIGIITYVKCDNYGAELQAYALQKKLRMLGYDAEVLDLEKQKKNLAGWRTVKTAIKNRYKQYGLFKGTLAVVNLIKTKYRNKKAWDENRDKACSKHQLFIDFFDRFISHSSSYYKLSDLYEVNLPYDVFIAGSDQIWNYMQTDYLDVYFLMFANRLHAKKIAYAGSFSVGSIPSDLKTTYKPLIENLDFISVRELNARDIVKSCSNRESQVVLDPTLLLTKSEWIEDVANKDYRSEIDKCVVIYTLSGSKYIYTLAKKIADKFNVKVVNIKNGYSRTEGDEGIIHLYDVGPREFITLFNKAIYVITDSFHGTAFSINFNIPFTTLLNPASNMNSRALSILEITGLQERLIWDNGDNLMPAKYSIDYDRVNSILEQWRTKSLKFLINSLGHV